MPQVFEDEVTAEQSAEFEHWFGVAEKRRDSRFQGSSVQFQVEKAADRESPGIETVLSSRPPLASPAHPLPPGPQPTHSLNTENLTLETPSSPTRKHVVSATLFWKHVNEGDPELPVPTRETLVDAKRMGLVKRFAPWESYIAPLFLHTPGAVARHPGVGSASTWPRTSNSWPTTSAAWAGQCI